MDNYEERSVSNAINVVPEEDLPKGRPKKGRKRKILSQSRADKKRLLNNNEPYVNDKGEVVDAKVFDEHFICNCTKKCTEAVELDLRRRFFRQFHSIGTPEGRWAMIAGNVSEMPKKRTYTKSISKRLVSRTYTIFGRRVCQHAFLKTLQINESRVTLALDKGLNSDTFGDGRGKSSGGRFAISPEKLEKIQLHIESFPKYISHYCRNQTNSKYLSSNLNLVKMFELYENSHDFPVSFASYKKIFYENYNLRFKRPHKDTCLRCDLFIQKKMRATEATLREIEEAHMAHLDKAALLRNQMNEDLALAQIDEELEVLTFDLQKTHPLPNVPTNIAYYSRQLNLYNLGIHVGSTKNGIFNVWQENEGSRGTQEVGSCLKKQFDQIKAPVKKVILWSDACGGQNRSIKLILMLMHILQNHSSLETISARYLQPGHSFLPNDDEFGDVECLLKQSESLFTIDDYVDKMKACRRENKFEVRRLSADDFYSVKSLEKAITNRKYDLNKNKINWLDTHEILLKKNEPTIIRMKKTPANDFQTVNIGKWGKGPHPCFKDIRLEKLWPNGKALSKEKIKDLKALLSLVPEESLKFYSFLENVKEGDFIDDVEGFGETIDFEVEFENY